jgi:hypothetical protein
MRFQNPKFASHGLFPARGSHQLAGLQHRSLAPLTRHRPPEAFANCGSPYMAILASCSECKAAENLACDILSAINHSVSTLHVYSSMDHVHLLLPASNARRDLPADVGQFPITKRFSQRTRGRWEG